MNQTSNSTANETQKTVSNSTQPSSAFILIVNSTANSSQQANVSKNETEDAQKKLMEEFKRNTEELQNLQNQLNQPIQLNTAAPSQSDVVAKILREHEANVTKNATSLIGKNLTLADSSQQIGQTSSQIEDNINQLKKLFGTQEEEKPVEVDRQAIIARTLEAAKEEQQRKLHPLGGYLGDMFNIKGMSDQILSNPETAPIVSPLDKAGSSQSTAQSSLDLIANMTKEANISLPSAVPEPSQEQTKAAIQKTLELVKEKQYEQTNFAKSIGSNAGSLLKSIQGTSLDLPEELKVTEKSEKNDDERRARDLANAISQASAQSTENEVESSIMDPDEYRLKHPFTGSKNDVKSLADRLNGWEKNNELVYKLEADKLKSVADEAQKNQTLIIKNNNSTTTIVISVQNENSTATLQVNTSNSTSQLPQNLLKNLTVAVNQTSNATANKTQNVSQNTTIAVQKNATVNSTSNSTANSSHNVSQNASKNTTPPASQKLQSQDELVTDDSKIPQSHVQVNKTGQEHKTQAFAYNSTKADNSTVSHEQKKVVKRHINDSQSYRQFATTFGTGLKTILKSLLHGISFGAF